MGHLDHVGAASELAQQPPTFLSIGPEKEDEFWLQGPPAQSRMFGSMSVAADAWIAG